MHRPLRRCGEGAGVPSRMRTETIGGSCHCGAVCYTARLDLGAPTLRCNCSICTKSRTWIAPIPASDFQLASGESMLAEYRFGEHAITHCFCALCGVKTHGRVDGRASA